jgi:predicted tellurium resistance membrane protein TerC
MNMRQKLPSVTTLQQSPTEERRVRLIKYTVAMTIRVVCIVLMIFVQGWWLLLCAAGAIFLPYFAVIIANAARIGSEPDVARPGPLMVTDEGAESPSPAAAWSETVTVTARERG